MSMLDAWKQEKNYRRLFWSGTISGIGGRISQVALFTLLYQITGSTMAIGLFLQSGWFRFFFLHQ